MKRRDFLRSLAALVAAPAAVACAPKSSPKPTWDDCVRWEAGPMRCSAEEWRHATRVITDFEVRGISLVSYPIDPEAVIRADAAEAFARQVDAEMLRSL